MSYEVFYAERGRIETRAGAQLLVDPTNTSSYLTSQVPTQEIAASTVSSATPLSAGDRAPEADGTDATPPGV